MEEISVFDVLGLHEDQLKEYSIRLNNNLLGFDATSAYFTKRDDLLEHGHTGKWPTDNNRHNIRTPKTLQFVKLSSANDWLFIGASDLTGEEYQTWYGATIAAFTMNPDFNKFEGRLVVRYHRKRGNVEPGALTRNLSKENIRQYDMKEMVVDRIVQNPIAAEPFPGFESVRLTHAQLTAAVKNIEWREALQSVSAVYLQTDKLTGWHYVGSAYSRSGKSKGLLSRWTEYTEGDHTGGNQKLRELVAREGKEYIANNFVYSVLEIFDRRATSNEVINREHWWMDTLGSVYSEKAHSVITLKANARSQNRKQKK